MNYVKKHKLLIILLTKLYELKLTDNKLISNVIYITRF